MLAAVRFVFAQTSSGQRFALACRAAATCMLVCRRAKRCRQLANTPPRPQPNLGNPPLSDRRAPASVLRWQFLHRQPTKGAPMNEEIDITYLVDPNEP